MYQTARVPKVYETTMKKLKVKQIYFTFTNGQKNEKINKKWSI